MAEYRISEYGAVSDSEENCASSIQQAIEAAYGAGGGTVVVPAGQTFVCGSIELRSRVSLRLEPGAVLRASPNIDDYINYGHIELFAESDFCRFWIFGRDSEQITIEGEGTLDGNSPAFTIQRFDTHTLASSPRAQSVVFLGCQDIAIRNIRIVNTPSWALRPAGCDRVLIENVTILNDLGLVNSDGIDIDCSRSVRIANCHVEAGDDAICVKGRREIAARYGACEDIVVTGCTLESHCCAFRLGVESWVDFRRIVFSSSTIRRSHRGIAIDCRDECVVEDVLISDIVVDTIHSPRIWWHEGEAIWISQVPYVQGHYGPGSNVARFRNIVFRNISITTEQGIYVQGADDQPPPSDILFDNVRVHIKKHTRHPAGFYDPRPNRPGFTVAGSDGIEDASPYGTLFRHKISAFFFDRARDVTLRNCRVTWADGLPDAYAHALEAWDTPGLVIENFQGVGASPSIEPIAIRTNKTPGQILLDELVE